MYQPEACRVRSCVAAGWWRRSGSGKLMRTAAWWDEPNPDYTGSSNQTETDSLPSSDSWWPGGEKQEGHELNKRSKEEDVPVIVCNSQQRISFCRRSTSRCYSRAGGSRGRRMPLRDTCSWPRHNLHESASYCRRRGWPEHTRMRNNRLGKCKKNKRNDI